MDILTNPVVKRFVEAGEAQVNRITNQLLANEKFLQAVQNVVSKTLSARGNLDKSLRSALATMNLPSTADVEGIKSRLDDLDRTMTELDARFSRLEERWAKGEAPKATPPKKKPAPAAKKAPARKKAGEPEGR